MVSKTHDKSAASQRQACSNGIWERARHNATNDLWHIADLPQAETVRVKSHASQCLVMKKTWNK